MKRIIQYCILLFLVSFHFFLVPSHQSWAADPYDAALFIPRGDAFWLTFASYTKASAENIGLNLEVYNANENRETMLTQVEETCQKGVDVIIFMNYQGIGESILQIAENHKTPAFLVNTTFKDKVFTPREKYRYWIGELTADDMNAGTLLARRLSEIAEKKGIKELNIFAFEGVKEDVASILRVDGLESFVGSRTNAEIIGSAAANWDREQAKSIFKEILSEHPEINMVWGANDRMAQGASEAAREPWIS